jgi:hypothetical protein
MSAGVGYREWFGEWWVVILTDLKNMVDSDE